MKRFLILLIICTSSSWSQEVKTQKEILQLQNTDLVKDFNLKTKGNIKPVMVNKSTYNDVGFGFVDKKFSYAKKDYSQKILTFKETKLTSYNSQFHYNFGKTNRFDFKYFYDEKGNLKEMTSKSSSSNYISKTSYTYSSNNKIKKINETGTYADGKKYDKITNYIYKGNLISYDFENGSKTIHLKNNLVTKQVTFNKSANKTYTDSYQYNSNGFLTYEDKGTSKYTYTFNNKNLLKTVISKNHTSHYKYVYDKYGNWIVAYQLAISEKDYSGNKISPHLYGSRFAFHVREIKYSNGDVTGSVNPEDSKTKNKIIRIRTELYDSLVEASVSYSKTANSSYLFKIDGQQEARNTASGFMNRSLLVFHKPTKQLFICEDFGDKEEGKDFPAKKIDIDTKNGYWYRTPKGIIHVFKADGTYIEKFNVFKYATNDIDAILQENNDSPQILLENYRNSASYKVYPVINYDSYNPEKIVNNNTKKKESLGKCIKGDCENGYGEYEFENGFKADGFFENGKPNGPMHLNDKAKNESRFSTYKGSYENSVGMTYRYYKNRYTDIIDYEKQIGVTNDATEKRTYKLNFKNGKAVSKTEMTGHNINSGCIIGNCTSGSGVYIYNNGAMYFGTFQNGKRHGFGKLDFKGGNLYVGEFQNGNYHGLGTYVWSEYNYYMGEYQNGKYHGKGVMYYNKDRYDAGNWENGKLTTKTNIYNKTNVYNNTTINDYTKKNTTGFNSFSSSERNTIQECNGDAKCVGSYFNSLYESNEKSLSKDQLEQKMTDYYHSLYNMDSKLAYDAIFKMKISTMKSVQIKKLPQVIQDDLKNRATKLNNAYKKDLKKKGY